MMRTHPDQSSEFCRTVADHLTALVARQNFSEAVRHFESQRRRLDAEGGFASARAYHAAARAWSALGEYAKALKAARQAENMAMTSGEMLTAAEIAVTAGGILRNMGEFKSARKAFQDAESIFRRHGRLEEQSRALNLLAGIYYHRKEFRNALNTLMDAVEIARRLDDKKKLAYMMGNIGRIQFFLGDFVQAEKHLKINIELSEESGNTLDLGRARLSLGYLYVQQARYDLGETLLEAAYRDIVAAGSTRDEVIYLTYLGELQYRREAYDSARETLNKAVAAAGRIAPGSTLLGRAWRHLAELNLRTGHFHHANRLAARAYTIMREHHDLMEMGALNKIRALVAANSGKSRQARTFLQKALNMLDEVGVRWEKAAALLEAGACAGFSRRQRLACLFRAEEFYAASRLTIKLNEVTSLLHRLDKATPAEKEQGTAGECEFVTANAEIRKFLSQLPVLASSDLPVLLTGETGVGKDHMARCFHAAICPGKPFVAINCASVPETLLESELFGYHKGAFTGADGNKPGLIMAANGGVLFLDEIGEMPLSLQAKLLGVLEHRKLTPLGSTKEVELDIHLVAATNCDLEMMVEEGRFRRDLYYRLCGITFNIPPLRERKEDIILLAQRFMVKSGLLQPGAQLPVDVARQLLTYEWPGNIRELQNRVKRLEVMRRMVADGDLSELVRSVFGPGERVSNETSDLFSRVEEFECRLLTEALLASGGNKSQAARLLGIHEATVRTKLKRYGIKVPSMSAN